MARQIFDDDLDGDELDFEDRDRYIEEYNEEELDEDYFEDGDVTLEDTDRSEYCSGCGQSWEVCECDD